MAIMKTGVRPSTTNRDLNCPTRWLSGIRKRGDVPRCGVRAECRAGSALVSLCRHELGGRHLLGRSREERHGAFREVAAVADLPLVMGLDQDRPGQPQQGLGVGEDPTTSVRRLISLLSRSKGLVDQTFLQWLGGNEVKASRSGAASRSMRSSLGNCRPSIPAMTSSWSWT